jgi:tetratricopeptide (TPR) repeat protein
VYRYHLARALEQSGDWTAAAAEYREAIRLAPTVPVPYRGLGLLLERQGDHEQALAALERAAGLDPGGTVMDGKTRALLETLRRRAAGRSGF